MGVHGVVLRVMVGLWGGGVVEWLRVSGGVGLWDGGVAEGGGVGCGWWGG